jgi:ribosomal protein S27AE
VTAISGSGASEGEEAEGMSKSITCPRCGMTSHNVNDVLNLYCGNCHIFLGEYPDPTDADEIMQVSEKIVRKIRPLLTNLGPATQGWIIADLLAMWICGYQPHEKREEIFDLEISQVRELMKAYLEASE